MPVVRRLQPQVDLNPLPGVRQRSALTSEAAGEGLALAKGRAAAQVGQAVEGLANQATTIGVAEYGKLQEEAKQQADQTAILNATTDFYALKTKFFYDGETGQFTKTGDAANTIPDAVQSGFIPQVDAIDASLNSPEQKMAFARFRTSQLADLNEQVQHHLYAQHQAMHTQAAQSAVSLAISDTIRKYANPLQFRASADTVLGMIAQNARALGFLTPQAVEKAQLAAASQMNVAAINNFHADGQDAVAQAWLAAAEKTGQVDPDLHDELTARLQAGNDRAQAQQAFDAIRLGGGTEEDQRAKAMALPAAITREVLAYVEHEWAVKGQQDQEAERKNRSAAYETVYKTHSVLSIPNDVWSALGPHQPDLLSYAKFLDKTGGVERDNLNTLQTLISLRATDPVAYVKEDVLTGQYPRQLTYETLKSILHDQGQIHAGLAPNPAFFASEATQGQIIGSALRDMGLDETRAKKDNDADTLRRIEAFRRSVREAVAREQARPENAHRNVPDTQVQSIVDELSTSGFSRVTAKGTWRDTMGPAYAFETAQAQITTTSQIPQAELRSMRAAFARQHVANPTDAQLITLYNLNLRRVRKD